MSGTETKPVRIGADATPFMVYDDADVAAFGETLAAVRAALAAQGADDVLGDDELRAIILAVGAAQSFAPARHAYAGSAGGTCEMCGLPMSAACHMGAGADADDLTAAAEGGTPWQATLCVAGEPTVDSGIKRLLMRDGGSWLPLPLPLGLLDDTPHADMTTKSPVVGRIDNIWWSGDTCQAAGVFFDGSSDPSLAEQAGKAAALVGEMQRMGISVDLVDIDVEMRAWTDSGVEDLDYLNDPTAPGEPQPEATLPLDMPSSVEDAEDAAEEIEERDLIYAFTRWVIGGATICPIQALTPATISLAASGFLGERRYRWFSFSRLEAGPLTASAAGLAPTYPPRAWFERPEAAEPTPITVLDNGEVFGHIALWDSCHTGFPGRCVPPPKSPSNYAGFHLGQIRLEDGERLEVGTLTMDTSHAAHRLSADAAAAHYDHTGTQAAFVRAVDGVHGIWVSGTLSPRLEAADAQALMAAKPSGDWRQIFRGRGRDLIGALAVNVPGFPVPRTLVAAGIVDGADASVEFFSECEPCEEELGRQLAVEAASADGLEGLAALVS